MKLKTVRVRRTRPTAPALALALALTMLCVYLISLSAIPEGAGAASDEAAAAAPGEAELRLEGLEAAFVCDAVCGELTEARVAAANCAASGGAGMLLSESAGFAVVREAMAPASAPEGALNRSAGGLTLRLSGPASEIAAVSDAVAFLRAQATETASLASALDSGNADPGSLTALLELYRTQGARARDALDGISQRGEIVERLQSAVQSELDRLAAAAPAPEPGKLRLIHAAACAEWINLLNGLDPSNGGLTGDA